MPLTIEVADIFKDAYDLHAQSLKMLGEGDIRDAAEKAWCATKRATDALILARTGEEPTLLLQRRTAWTCSYPATPGVRLCKDAITAASTNFTVNVSTMADAVLLTTCAVFVKQ